MMVKACSQLNLRIDPEVHEQFQAKCRKLGVSMASVVEGLIREWMNTPEPDAMKRLKELHRRASRRS